MKKSTPSNQAAIANSFWRTASTYDAAALVQRRVVKQLLDYLPEDQPYDSVLEIGVGTGLLTRALAKQLAPSEWILNDLSEPLLQDTAQRIFLETKGVTLLSGDAAEVIDQVKQPLSLIASASTLQWLSDPFDFLKKAIDRLAPEGCLLIGTFGPSNLKEIKTLTGRGLKYYSMKRYDQFLSNYFEEFSIWEERITLEFPSFLSLLRHLRNTGVTHLPGKDQEPIFRSREALKQLEDAYRERFATPKGLFPLTYHPIYICCEDC